MADWKRLENLDDILGKEMLLRETYPVGTCVTHYCGFIVKEDEYLYSVKTVCGKETLNLHDYSYEYLFLDEL